MVSFFDLKDHFTGTSSILNKSAARSVSLWVFRDPDEIPKFLLNMLEISSEIFRKILSKNLPKISLEFPLDIRSEIFPGFFSTDSGRKAFETFIRKFSLWVIQQFLQVFFEKFLHETLQKFCHIFF